MMHRSGLDKRRILHPWSPNIELTVHPRLIDAIPTRCDDKCLTCRIRFRRQAEPVLTQKHIGRRILTESVAKIAVLTQNHKEVRFEINHNNEQQHNDENGVWSNDVGVSKCKSGFGSSRVRI